MTQATMTQAWIKKRTNISFYCKQQLVHNNVSVSVSFISAPPQQKQKEINKHIGLEQKKKKEEATKR